MAGRLAWLGSLLGSAGLRKALRGGIQKLISIRFVNF